MGNRIAAELIDALRSSTFGTTLCSRGVNEEPAFVDIAQFPGVAKAMVSFFGDYSTPNTNCTIERSYNVKNVTYLGPGNYRITFNDNLFPRTYSNYIVTGSLNKELTPFLSAANVFHVQQNTNSSLAITYSSFCIITMNSAVPAISALNARRVQLAIF